MSSYFIGLFVGAIGMLIIVVAAYETGPESKVFDHTQDIINECQLELPRNEICVLKTVPEGEMK